MKKLIFLLLPIMANGQTLVDSCEVQYFQFKTIQYDNETFETLRRHTLTAEMTKDSNEFKAVDENGEFWMLKKKKKGKGYDSQIHVLDANGEPYFKGLTTTSKKWNYTKTLIGCGVAFVGGVANGYHETILNHYPKFKKVHPNANAQYWNPEISWLNKYEDFDRYGKREAYFGSTTFLAWTTDAYHLTSVISNTSLIGATCIITIGEKRKWWEYGIDILAMSLSRSAGFHLIYSQIYK